MPALKRRNLMGCNCFTRREMLRRSAGGIGSLALTGMLGQLARADSAPSLSAGPLAPKQPHLPAKAKSVIFLYMTGGTSHVESFDYKPKLLADHGKELIIDNWQG